MAEVFGKDINGTYFEFFKVFSLNLRKTVYSAWVFHNGERHHMRLMPDGNFGWKIETPKDQLPYRVFNFLPEINKAIQQNEKSENTSDFLGAV